MGIRTIEGCDVCEQAWLRAWWRAPPPTHTHHTHLSQDPGTPSCSSCNSPHPLPPAPPARRPSSSQYEAHATTPSPAATMQALLQLLGKLAQRYSNAQVRGGLCVCFTPRHGWHACCGAVGRGMRSRLHHQPTHQPTHLPPPPRAPLSAPQLLLAQGGVRKLLSLPAACLAPLASRQEPHVQVSNFAYW